MTNTGRTDRIKRTVEILIERFAIPNKAVFNITEDMLDEYIEVYGSLGSGENRKFQRSFARKLAGLELLRLKFFRGAAVKDCKEGMVYLIGNPAWPDHLKIGMTVDITARLGSYQTYDPYKKFYVARYEFCLDRRAAEDKLLKDFGIHLVDGEWIKHSDSLRIIDVIRPESFVISLHGSSSRQSNRPLTCKMSVRGRPVQPIVYVPPPRVGPEKS